MRNLIEMLQGVEERLNDLTLIHPYIIFFFNIYSYFSLERGDNWKVIQPACGDFKAAAVEGGVTVFAALV